MYMCHNCKGTGLEGYHTNDDIVPCYYCGGFKEEKFDEDGRILPEYKIMPGSGRTMHRCIKCKGDGLYESSYRDPVDGYEGLSVYRCERCKGLGSYGTNDERILSSRREKSMKMGISQEKRKSVRRISGEKARIHFTPTTSMDVLKGLIGFVLMIGLFSSFVGKSFEMAVFLIILLICLVSS